MNTSECRTLALPDICPPGHLPSRTSALPDICPPVLHTRTTPSPPEHLPSRSSALPPLFIQQFFPCLRSKLFFEKMVMLGVVEVDFEQKYLSTKSLWFDGMMACHKNQYKWNLLDSIFLFKFKLNRAHMHKESYIFCSDLNLRFWSRLTEVHPGKSIDLHAFLKKNLRKS